MDSTRIVLVRHGQAIAGVNRIVGGHKGCTGLSDLGREQAQALAARLGRTGELADATALMSSTLPRAFETAAILAPALGGLVVDTDPGLCELEPGDADGLTWEEMEHRFGLADFPAEPFRPLAPGGESWASFGVRVGATLHRVAAGHLGGTVVCACHGGVIEQSVLHGLGLPAQFPPGHRLGEVPNTSITEWRVRLEPGRPQHWQLIRYADAGHLQPGS